MKIVRGRKSRCRIADSSTNATFQLRTFVLVDRVARFFSLPNAKAWGIQDRGTRGRGIIPIQKGYHGPLYSQCEDQERHEV
jgi:hypothetical protein